MTDKKTVCMPIEVPVGEFCVGGERINGILPGPCEYYDNSGGRARCKLGFYPLEIQHSTGFVWKNERCAALSDLDLASF